MSNNLQVHVSARMQGSSGVTCQWRAIRLAGIVEERKTF